MVTTRLVQWKEDKYFGKLGVMDSDPERRMNQDEGRFLRYKEMSSAGFSWRLG